MAYSGKYKIKNPEKYVGGDSSNIIYRSLWERQLMVKFDTNPKYISWNSECVIIPYLSDLDNSVHRYFVDFYVKYVNSVGSIEEALIEVKPFKETQKPKSPKNNWKSKQRYIRECATYMTNMSKWKAAREFCRNHGYKFIIITEKELRTK